MKSMYNIYIDGKKLGKSESKQEGIDYLKENYHDILPYLTWESTGCGGVDRWSNGYNEIIMEKIYPDGIDLVFLIDEYSKKQKRSLDKTQEEEIDEEKIKMAPFTPKRTTLKTGKNKKQKVEKEGKVIIGEDGKKYISKKTKTGAIKWFRFHEKNYKGTSAKGRKSPEKPAKDYKEGTVKKGIDGEKWVVKKTANGILKWVRK